MSNISRIRFSTGLAFALLIIWSCSSGESIAERTITAEDLVEAIKVLASDEFEGRGPASRGEELTVEYLAEGFQELGLEPGNGDSYFQEVPMVELTPDPGAGLVIWGEQSTTRLIYRREYVVWTKRVIRQVALERSDLIFVGYGTVAPEYEWDDYRGLDVRGKTVVMLVNDPGYATKDSSLFNGHAMTYYGRWTYKFEEAARQGAGGAIIIHETEPAGYPWGVVRSSWTGPQFDLATEDNNLSRCAVEGWFTEEVARDLFRRSGHDFEDLKQQAASRGFRPLSLNVGISVTVANTIRRSTSRNVLALLPGRKRADEVLIYTAHWDHLGMDPNLRGDKIYNGALDNATGTAGLLELAEAFTELRKPPERSILFLAVTAEEQGLLGSAYYATHPIYPLANTVAVMNMDGMNIYGRMKDVTIIGYGNSELDDYAIRAARKQHRVVRPDPEVEKGYFYRSDHFSFAKEGVPALYLDSGIDHVIHGEAWTREQTEIYTAERYHKPSDEYDPEWDLSGAVEDLRLLFMIGTRLSNTSDFPNWSEGNEFRAARDAMMQAHQAQAE
ncbi:MAG: M28 family peptidase [Fidelibacterota bacterium]|nr:MAG: M28 family peptidase [Candidatus Neomarinimicrobiota bacterium]